MTTFSPPHPSPSFSRLLSLYLSHPPTLPPNFSICLLQHTCLSFLFTLITITNMFIHSPILLCVFLQTKKVYEMETPEKLEQAEIRKAKGTDFFKVNWFEKNIFCFVFLNRSDQLTSSQWSVVLWQDGGLSSLPMQSIYWFILLFKLFCLVLLPFTVPTSTIFSSLWWTFMCLKYFVILLLHDIHLLFFWKYSVHCIHFSSYCLLIGFESAPHSSVELK